jgi:hypothetical protein
VVALVALVLVLGGGGAYVLLRSHAAGTPTARGASGSPSASTTTTPTPSPTEDIALERKEKLSAPNRIGAYRKSTDPNLTAQAETSRQQLLKGSPGIRQAVVAYYDNTQKYGQSAIVLASTYDVANPGSELFYTLDSDNIQNLNSVDPGPLGGVAQCGTLSAHDTNCGWADYGSLGLVEFVGVDPAEAAADLLQFRAAIVARG